VEPLGERIRLVREQLPTVPGMTAAGESLVVEATLAQLTERARALVACGERRILGITGPRGAGGRPCGART
jgi:hypothetical protein